MVDNYIPFLRSAPSSEEVVEILDASDATLDGIIHSISRRESGNLNKFEGKGSKFISFIAGNSYAKRRPTSSFNLNENCTGCGICESICPTASISVIDGKAVWVKENCDICFGCLHRCPNEAINYKNTTQGKGRYINPRTKL